MSEVICNELGYRKDCDTCQHGKLHNPITGIISHQKNGTKDSHLCNTLKGQGYCYIGTHDRIKVWCIDFISLDRPMETQFTMNTQAINKMYHSLYWGQIFNLNTCFKVKWIAIRSLWIMHKW